MSKMSEIDAELRNAGIDPEHVDLARLSYGLLAIYRCPCGFIVDEPAYLKL